MSGLYLLLFHENFDLVQVVVSLKDREIIINLTDANYTPYRQEDHAPSEYTYEFGSQPYVTLREIMKKSGVPIKFDELRAKGVPDASMLGSYYFTHIDGEVCMVPTKSFARLDLTVFDTSGNSSCITITNAIVQ